MFITRDYLKVDPWTSLIQLINDNYNFELQPGIVRLKEMVPKGAKRTQIEIIPNRSTREDNSLPEITETVFTYDRLDAGEFFRTTPAVNIDGLITPITTIDILNQIGERNDIVFGVDDFIGDTYDHYTAGSEADIVIRANPLSLRWVGEMKVRLVNTKRIDFTNKVFEKVSFPDISPNLGDTKIVGDYYVTRYNFTLYRDRFKDVKVGLFNRPDSLLLPLYSLTGLDWKAVNQMAPFNIVNQIIEGERFCKVLYNGAPTPWWSRRTEFNRVLVIELSPDYSTEMLGFIRIHYD
jgi:hypothetical protein